MTSHTEVPLKLDRALASMSLTSQRFELITRLVSAIQDVDTGKAQRVVLNARRMPLLYWLASRNGVRPVRDQSRKVFCSRFLDFLPDGDWLDNDPESPPTLAMDDVEMTGDTMEALVGSISRLTGKTENIVKYPLLSVDPMDRKAAERLHREFAISMAVNQIPYFSDFAISRPVEGVQSAVVQQLLGDKSWRSVEVTGAPISGSRAGVCSLFLTGELGEQFMKEIGPVARFVSVAKVRMFFTLSDTGFNLRFVPIVLTRPLPCEGLARWLSNPQIDLAQGRRDNPEVLEAAAGLATMILSTKLLSVFSAYMRSQYQLEVGQDQDFVDLILGEALVGKADADKAQTLTDMVPIVAEPSLSRLDPVFIWNEKQWDSFDNHVGDDVLKGFYREILTTRPDQPGDGPRHISLSRLSQTLNLSWEALSVGLDVGNDGGWCVPRYYIDADHKYVEREYRVAERTLDYDLLTPGRAGGCLAAILTSKPADFLRLN